MMFQTWIVVVLHELVDINVGFHNDESAKNTFVFFFGFAFECYREAADFGEGRGIDSRYLIFVYEVLRIGNCSFWRWPAVLHVGDHFLANAFRDTRNLTRCEREAHEWLLSTLPRQMTD